MWIESGVNLLAGGEKGDSLRRHLNGVTGFGIATLTRTTGAAAKAAKAAQLYFITCLEGLHDRGEEQIDNLSRLLLGHLRFESHLGHEVGFGHSVPFIALSLRHKI
jgi:hypothetical protein